MRRFIFRLNKTLKLNWTIFVSIVSSHWKLFLLGFLAGTIFIFLGPKIYSYFYAQRQDSVGLAGNYSIGSLPKLVKEEISFGLLKVDQNGNVSPAAALSWEMKDAGKTLVFKLNTELFWQDGVRFDSSSLNFNLKGVDFVKDAPDQISFHLKEPFAPLLPLLSQPLFKDGLVGLGDKRVESIKLMGRFVSSLDLLDKNSKKKETLKFFANEELLVTALKLGTIQKAVGLQRNPGMSPKYFSTTSTTDPGAVATLFFNTQKEPFIDKSFRQGLVYALPEKFGDSQLADSSMRLGSWAISPMAKKYVQNLDQAKKQTGKTATQSGNLKIVLSTSANLEIWAKEIADLWNGIGIKADIFVTEIPQPNFDAFLTLVELPLDPDQYFLWHSTQTGNISGFKSPKIDKLLEEGRRTIDQKNRKEIYAQFQKALTEEAPATFLFYPKIYEVSRLAR